MTTVRWYRLAIGVVLVVVPLWILLSRLDAIWNGHPAYPATLLVTIAVGLTLIAFALWPWRRDPEPQGPPWESDDLEPTGAQSEGPVDDDAEAGRRSDRPAAGHAVAPGRSSSPTTRQPSSWRRPPARHRPRAWCSPPALGSTPARTPSCCVRWPSPATWSSSSSRRTASRSPSPVNPTDPLPIIQRSPRGRSAGTRSVAWSLPATPEITPTPSPACCCTPRTRTPTCPGTRTCRSSRSPAATTV